MGRRSKHKEFLMADGGDEYVDVWGRFTENNELEVWYMSVDDGQPQFVLGEEELRTLTRELVQRFPLEAMGGV